MLAAAAAVALLGTPLQVQATSIAISNASFENPDTPGSASYGSVDDWTILPGTGGVWDISSDLGGCPGTCWNSGAPDGDQIGWLAVGPANQGNSSSMSQVLSAVLLANQSYTLTGYVGHPINFQAGTLYTVELFAGSTVLASLTGTGPEGSFEPFSLSYLSGTGPEVGQALQIRLSSNQAQTGFDKIALSVPDGGMTLTLLGGALVALGALRRKLKP